MKKAYVVALASSFLAIPSLSSADTTRARCDIYPTGEDSASASMLCHFSQRQGHITIRREDGVDHELTPMFDRPGNFTDQHGSVVYRNSGLRDQGIIFRFPEESVYVYWSTAGLEASASDDHASLQGRSRCGDGKLPGGYPAHGARTSIRRCEEPERGAVHHQFHEGVRKRYESISVCHAGWRHVGGDRRGDGFLA